MFRRTHGFRPSSLPSLYGIINKTYLLSSVCFIPQLNGEHLFDVTAMVGAAGDSVTGNINHSRNPADPDHAVAHLGKLHTDGGGQRVYRERVENILTVLFHQVGQLRTSSHLQLRPGQDKAKQCDTNNNRVTHGVNKHTVNNTIEKKYIYSVCKWGRIREVRQ